MAKLGRPAREAIQIDDEKKKERGINERMVPKDRGGMEERRDEAKTRAIPATPLDRRVALPLLGNEGRNPYLALFILVAFDRRVNGVTRPSFPFTRRVRTHHTHFSWLNAEQL